MVLVNLAIEELQTLNAAAYRSWEVAVEGIWRARDALPSRYQLLSAGMPDPTVELTEYTASEAHYNAEMTRYGEFIAAAKTLGDGI